MSARSTPHRVRSSSASRRFKPVLETLESWEMPGQALPYFEMLLMSGAAMALSMKRAQDSIEGDVSHIAITEGKWTSGKSRLFGDQPVSAIQPTGVPPAGTSPEDPKPRADALPEFPPIFVDPLQDMTNPGGLPSPSSGPPNGIADDAAAPGSSVGKSEESQSGAIQLSPARAGGMSPPTLELPSPGNKASPSESRQNTSAPRGTATPADVGSAETFIATGTPYFGDNSLSARDSDGADRGTLFAAGGKSFSAASGSGTGMLVVAPDAGILGRVKVVDPMTGRDQFHFRPYGPSFRGGVRVAVADVTGDGTPDIVTGPGPGGGSLVKVFNGRNGKPLGGSIGSFQAYGAGVTDGIYVAAGDVNADGFADIITGTDQAGRPRAKVFDGQSGKLLARWLVDPLGPASGVRVAAGDVNGDGKADIITGMGQGASPRVCVWDGGTRAELYNFFAFDTTFRGGVDVAAGDVSGDGLADILVGCGPGGGPWVRVFSGATSASLMSLLAYRPSFTGGVRVSAVDADLNGTVDIVTAAGPGGNRVRVFDAHSQTQISGFRPYGASFKGGLFIGADPRSGEESPGALATGNPVVTIQATAADIKENGGTPGVFTVSRTGDTTDDLFVNVCMSGTAVQGDDFAFEADAVKFFYIPAGQRSATINVSPVDGTVFEPLETVVATICPGPGYDIGASNTAVVSICDDDGPPPFIPEEDCGCGDDELIDKAFGVRGDVATADAGGVRYGDGLFELRESDLFSHGFGRAWGQNWSWSNGAGYAADYGGTDAVVCELPQLRQDSEGTIAVVTNAATARFFDPSGGSYLPRFFLKEQLTYDAVAGEFNLTDSSGNRITFHDFSTGLPASQRGQFKSFTDSNGNVTSVTDRTSDGKPVDVQHSSTVNGTTITESYLVAYFTTGSNAGRMSNITLRRQTDGGAWTTIRQVDYTYYDGTQSFGNPGNLRTAVVKDASGAVIDTSYFRYYTSGESNGYQNGLKYAFSPQSYSRLAAAFVDPFTASDVQVAPYADVYLEYDSVRRVQTQIVQGAGCTVCTGGQGTFSFTYSTSSFPDGYNTWRRKTVETLPDGNQNIIYTNYAGEAMLQVFKEVSTGRTWATYHRYDNDGRRILQANPSAISGFDETRPDLLNNQSGNHEYLRDASGLIETFTYYTTTTAGETTAGGVAGYERERRVQRGELGTPVLQHTLEYFAHTGGGATTHPIATSTVYRNSDGTGAQTTSFGYTFSPGSTQVQSLTATYAAVSAAQNGPGTPVVETTFFDAYGRVVWRKDGEGFIRYVAYDQATGAVIKSIVDVDTTRTGDFQNLPAGWSTPTGGGLHLISQTEVDGLGRAVAVTEPNGNVSYMVYNDPLHEVRAYVGWQAATNLPTGPTQVSRENRQFSTTYYETVTMSATPAVSGGRPTGAEPISDLQALKRSYISAGGQHTRTDEYFNLTGLTYSTALFIGTSGTNYNTTTFGYDKRGRRERIQLATGTITRMLHDGLGRLVSTWVGTNDTPGSGFWSPTNNTPPANMVKVLENEYDAGGVGDSMLTQSIEFPGSSEADRVSQYYYDWRGRQVASKQGVEDSESDAVNRPVFYVEFDNLSRGIVYEQYDGDGVTIGDSDDNGVPDRPADNLRRARSTSSFDELGRNYRTQVYSVDQTTGEVSAQSLVSDTWFDRRGLPIKSTQPGGLVSKNKFDGARRLMSSHASDGGSDTTWADAGNVAGDVVLEQREMQYDLNGNVLLVVTRQRFHDETATGELGNPTTGPKARVSYAARYYDAADRLTDSVDVGTNGGVAWSRPATPPARSDTVLVESYGYNNDGMLGSVTDPRGVQDRFFYDALGRKTKVIEAYVDGVPGNDDDRTTEFTYNASGHVLTLKNLLAGGGYQTTQWDYGVTTATGSQVNSNELPSALKYPDKVTGNPSETEKEVFTFNAQGEEQTRQDRAGNVHAYSYDVLGRLTADAVTTLGAGVDGAVRRLETAYDTAGRPFLFTSYDAAAFGNVVNQVQRGFNGLEQLTVEYQALAGAVDPGTTPKVEYGYSEMAGGANHSRPTSVTYPNGRVINHEYAAGIDNAISRLSSVSDASATLEALTYLGLSTVVRRTHPQSDIDLTYIKQTGEANGDAGDQYTGLDRFDRIVDQRWIRTSDGSHTDRFQYGYDRVGNPLFQKNLVDAAFSELYHANGSAGGYDAFEQLTDFRRGVLSDSNGDGVPDTVTTATRSQGWAYDALGNWSALTSDGSPQNRTHNQQSQITSISGATTPTYDANGNLTRDETGRQFVYDAWNRIVQVKDAGGTPLVIYGSDALGRRTTETATTTRALFYSSSWQVVEEHENGVVRVQHVWSPVYVDALVARDRDADGNSANGLEERIYAQHDGAFNVTAVVKDGGVVERYVYDPFGQATILQPDWSVRGTSLFAWNILHKGGRFSEVSGLYHFRHRDYSPTLGRWNRPDPLGVSPAVPQFYLNLYLYVGNRPPSRLDASGLADNKIKVKIPPDNKEIEVNCQVPDPPKPGEQVVPCQEKDIKDEGLTEKQAKDCKDFLAKALENQGVKDILAVLKENNCKEATIACKCCTGPCKDAGAWHFPNSKIFICANNLGDQNAMIELLIHELHHEYQSCKKWPDANCEDRMKMEFQAYWCQKLGKGTFEEAFKAAVWSSCYATMCKPGEINDALAKKIYDWFIKEKDTMCPKPTKK